MPLSDRARLSPLPLLVFALIVSILGVVPTAGAAPTAGAGFERPAVGTCYLLKLGHARRTSLTIDPADCTNFHSSIVVAAKNIPSARLDSDSDNAVYCMRAMRESLGGTPALRAMSFYKVEIFYPNEEQRAQGASWVSCHVVLPTQGRFHYLQPAVPLIRGGKLYDSQRSCMMNNRLRNCDQMHNAAAERAVLLRRLPRTWDEAFAIARRRCGQGRTTPPITVPTDYGWKAGWRHLVCYG